jgi:hypothetical protein
MCFKYEHAKQMGNKPPFDLPKSDALSGNSGKSRAQPGRRTGGHQF